MASEIKLYAGVAAVIVAFSAASFLVLSGGLSLRSSSATFTGQSVTLIGLSYRPVGGANVQLGQVTLEGTNISPPQVAALFAPTDSGDGSREAFGKMTAEKILAPEIRIDLPGGGVAIVLRDVVAAHLQNGKATQITFGSSYIDVKIDAQNTKFTLGPLTLTDADAGFLFAALKGSREDSDFLRYGSLKWDGMTGATGGDSTSPFGAAITVGATTGDNTSSDGMPKSFEFDVGSIHVAPNGGVVSAAMFTKSGLTGLELSLHIKGSFDWPSHRLFVDDARLSLSGLGTLSMKGVLGNADKGLFAFDKDVRFAAIQALTMQSAALRFSNESLVEKVVSLMNGSSTKVGDIALANLPATLLGSHARPADSTAVTAFAAGPRNITLAIKPRPGTSPMSLRALTSVRDLSWFDTQIRAND